MLVFQEVTFLRGLRTGFIWGAASLLATVSVDSLFWGRWLWPEGEVLYFNTALNKSSEWGVFPWHWYFSSALPRTLHFTIPLILLALSGIRPPTSLHNVVPLQSHFMTAPYANSIRYYTFPSLVFIFLYSFLAHKELRFILPVIPLLVMAAAVGLDQMMPDSSQLEKKEVEKNGKPISPLNFVYSRLRFTPTLKKKYFVYIIYSGLFLGSSARYCFCWLELVLLSSPHMCPISIIPVAQRSSS